MSVPAIALAQTPPAGEPSPVRLAPVVVTATRTEVPAFDVPASIDRVGSETIREGKLQINLSESLGGVPGLVARDRQNYAQDVQLSIRGFGARSTFGIRGVRLYVDGIPATLPDGQGQITNVELGSTDRIEVLRGPFSALYGNSSGGVIQVFSEDGSGPPTVSSTASLASYDTRRIAARASGANGSFGYVVGASVFTTDGYRDHSAAERQLANAKLAWRPDNASTLTLVANRIDLPKARDPLGLTRAQFEADPRSVDPSAETFNTRKTVDQTQVGAIYERAINAANSVRLLLYGGQRDTEQFQAIPTGPQNNPLHPGGVISLDRNYQGADLRWSAKASAGDMPFSLVGGLAYDSLDERRKGYQNFEGSTLGVKGALRRDESNDVSNFDQYLQGSLQLSPRWSANAGVRHSSVRFRSEDRYIVGTNPDDSGSVDFSATLPVVGVLFAASDNVHLYATAGRGFETPTLNELAYRPNGETGLNLALQPARSKSVEVGAKFRFAPGGEATAAVFETHTEDEIVTQSNAGGRSTFQNAGATRRRGVELSATAELAADLRLQGAYTWLDATYRDAFQTCAATPCPTPNAPLTIPAGNKIPGIARSSFYAALAWAPPLGWRGGVEFRALSKVWVNDANADAAAGYATTAVNLGYLAKVGRFELSGFGRIDNLFDRRYIGSVIVGEGNSRFFEPAPGRSWGIGGSVAARF
ncbi:MAG: TonB-dependent receptor [Burkholderiales bacterium]|nr:TonB-dependent receptor [Burkholderiales bacterium]